MEKNYRIEYAENELNKAQAIENYVRKGIARDLDGVIDDLIDCNENGNEMTPTKVCIETFAFYLDLLKDVEKSTKNAKGYLDGVVAEEQAKDGDENEQR